MTSNMAIQGTAKAAHDLFVSMKRSMSLDKGATQMTDDAYITRPQPLYKYYSFNEWTEAIFERNQVYFQSPDCFNDPFDSKPAYTYEGTIEQRIERLIGLRQQKVPKGKTEAELRDEAEELVKSGRDIQELMSSIVRTAERKRKQLGIFCMAQRKNNLLMWSHYADHHKGFCLEFQTDNPFFGRVHSLVGRYSSDRPCVNLITERSGDDFFEALTTKLCVFFPRMIT